MVDVYPRGGAAPLLSRVARTSAPPEELELSWVVVDPAHVVELGLAVEDVDGVALSGEGTLRLLAAAMDTPKKCGEGEPEEARRRYQEFVRWKKGRKPSKARREALVDLCCFATSAVIVLAILAVVALW